jgi:hypothetical protein
MTLTNQTKILPKAVILTLSLMFLTAGAVNTCSAQQTSEDLLLKIMDLHSQLVGNEVFLAQAKMLGAYLEAAQSLEETKKIKIYKTVLQILTKIKDSPASIPPATSKTKEDDKDKTFEAEQEGRSVYVPGAALLEIFKVDSKTKSIPDLPVIRTYWKRDMIYSGGFLVPDRIQDVGKSARISGPPYLANFSFYYHANRKGQYRFTVLHPKFNQCKLSVGDTVILKSEDPVRPFGQDILSNQGVCNLGKGFHRIEFSLASEAFSEPGYAASFQVKILTPGAFDSVLLTKDLLLLKKE